MTLLLLAFITAWCFERVHFIISSPNYNVIYNGFGAIELTVKRQILAPMAYRVLVPLLVAGIGKLFKLPLRRRFDVYITVKVLLETVAFWLVALAWGPVVMLLTAVLLLSTIVYEYWDWAVELAAVAAAMTGNLVLAAILAVPAGMSRETAPILALAYYARTGDIGGSLLVLALAVVTMAAVRLWVGRRVLYCKRFMLLDNLKDYARRIEKGELAGKLLIFQMQPFTYSQEVTAVFYTAAILIAAAGGPVGWYIPVMLLAAGWLLAKSNEVRVWSACLPWVAAAILGVV